MGETEGRPKPEQADEAQLKALEERTDQLEADVTFMLRIIRRNSKVPPIIAVVLVLVVCGYVFAFFARVKRFDTTRFASLIQAESTQMLEDIAKSLGRVTEGVKPVALKEFRAAFDARGPELEKTAQKEAELLASNLEKSLGKQVEDGLKATMKKYEPRVKEAFPELKDEAEIERITKLLQGSFTMAARNVLVTKFGEHIDAMFRIQKALDSFEVDEKLSDAQLEARIKELFLEYVERVILFK